MGKQINVGLKFTADTGQAKASIQELQSLLNKLSLDGASTSKAAPTIEAKRIREAAEAAKELSYHLNNAYNAKTGRFDLSALDKSLKSSNTNVQELSTKLIGAGDTGQQAFLKLAQSISQADQPMLKISSRMQDFAKVLKQTAKYQLSNNLIRGFTGAIQSAYHYAQNLNASLTDIRIVTGYNTDQMAKFAEQANKAAKALSTTTTDYTKGSLIYFQQGLGDDEVRERTETTIKMANATGESTSKIADQMTAVWNNFADGSRELSYYADVMTALGAATASSTDEISEGINKFAATAKTVGLSYEYATAALATVTARTRESADVVGNAYRTLFARIQGLNQGETLDDGTTLNKYSTALDKVGVNIKTTSGELKGMDQILDELGPKWQSLANDQKMALAQTVAGVRQYGQFMALMNNYDYFKENVQVARDSTGTLEKQAEIYAESWEAAQKRVRAAAEGVYQDLIDDKFFISLNNGLADIISGLDNFIDKAGGLKTIIMALSGVILANFSNKIPEAIDKARYNFDVLTKGSDKAYQKIFDQMKSVSETQFQKYDVYQAAESKGKDTSGMEKGIDRNSALGLAIKQYEELSNAKNKYARMEPQLTEAERQQYQLSLQIAEMNQQEALSYAQKTEQIKLETEAQQKLLAAKTINPLTRKTSQNNLDLVDKTGQDLQKSSDTNPQLYKWATDQNESFYNALKDYQQKIGEQYTKIHQEIINSISNNGEFGQNLDEIFLFDTNSSYLANIQDMIAAMRNIAGSGMESEDALKALKNQLKALQGAFPDTIQEATGLDKVFRDLFKETDLDKFKIGLNELQQKIQGAKIPAKEFEKVVKEWDGKSIDALKEKLGELGIRLDEAKGKAKTASEAMNGINPQHTVRMSEALGALGGFLTSTVSGINSLSSAWKNLTDPDTSGFEKISSVILGTVSGLTMLANGYKALTPVIQSFNLAQVSEIGVSNLLTVTKKSLIKSIGQENLNTLLLQTSVKKAKGVKEEEIITNLKAQLTSMGVKNAKTAESQANLIYKASVDKANLSLKQQIALQTMAHPLITAIIAASIALAGVLIYNAVHAYQKANEKIDEANEKYAEQKQALDELKTKLEEVNQKIDELNSKGELSLVDAQDLKDLQTQKALLEAQLKIKQQIADLDQQSQANTISGNWDKSFGKNKMTKATISEYAANPDDPSGSGGMIQQELSIQNYAKLKGYNLETGLFDKDTSYTAYEQQEIIDKINNAKKQQLEYIKDFQEQFLKNEQNYTNILSAVTNGNYTWQEGEKEKFQADLKEGRQYIYQFDQKGYEDNYIKPIIEKISPANMITDDEGNFKISDFDTELSDALGVAEEEIQNYFSEGIDKILQNTEISGIDEDKVKQLSGKQLYTLINNLDVIGSKKFDNIYQLRAYLDGISINEDVVEATKEIKDNLESLVGITEDLHVGDILSEEDYNLLVSYNKELEKYFLYTGTKNGKAQYKYIGGADSKIDNLGITETVQRMRETNDFYERSQVYGYTDQHGKWQQTDWLSHTGETVGSQTLRNLAADKNFDWSLMGDGSYTSDIINDIANKLDSDDEAIRAEGVQLANAFMEAFKSTITEGSLSGVNAQEELLYSTKSTLKELGDFHEEIGNAEAYSKQLTYLARSYDEDSEAANNYQEALDNYDGTLEDLEKHYKEATRGARKLTDQEKQVIKTQQALAKEIRKAEWDKFTEKALSYAQALKNTKNVDKQLKGIQKAFKESLGMEVPMEALKKYKDLFIQWGEAGEEASDDIATQIYSLLNVEENALKQKDLFSEIELEVGADTSLAESKFDNLQDFYDSVKTIVEANPPVVDAQGNADFSNMITAMLEAGYTAADVAAALQAIGQTNVDFSAWGAGLPNVNFNDINSIINFINALNNWKGDITGSTNAPLTAESLKKAFPNGKVPATTGSGGGRHSSSNNSGGGGGGGKKSHADTKSFSDKERYHTIKNQIEDLSAGYDDINKAKDRAFGKDRLKYMDQEIAKTDELIKAQKKYLSEIENYLPIDKEIMEKAYNEYIGGPGIEYDISGNISNFDEIQDAMFDKYNSMANAYTDDSDEWKIFEKKYELLEKYIEQYEETYDLLRDQKQELQDLINQKIDIGLEQVQYSVEVKLDIPDDKIKFLEYRLGRIDDDAFKSIEAVTLLTKKADEVYKKIQINKEALNDVLKLSLSVGEITQLLAGDTSVLAGKSFTEDQINAIKEYRDNLLDLNSELDDVRENIEDKVMEAFDAWKEKVDTGISSIEHYGNILGSFRNIIDIVGKDTLGISNTFMNNLAQGTVDNAINKLEGTKKAYETIVKAREEASNKLAEAEARKDDASVKMWKDTLDQINEEIQSSSEEMMSAWEDALSGIAEQFENTMNDLIDTFNNSIYSPGGLDALGDDFQRQQDSADLLLDDYEKIYELSKLNRDINKSINDTDSLSGKQKLKKLLEQINDLQEDGNEMSKYDLEYLQKTYDLRLAEIELEEAQRAKNTVRLQKDSEGNWSYIYTQSSDAIDSAQQKYEDALYAMQDLSSNYVDEMSDKLISTSKEMEDALAAIRIQDYASIDDYYAAVKKVQDQYQEQLENQQNELQKALDNNKQLYNEDWQNYHNATGYKISDLEDFATTFKDTMLGTLLGSESDTANFTDLIKDSVYNLTLGLEQAAETYYANLEKAMQAAGTSTNDFAEDATEGIQQVVNASQQGTEAVNDMADQMKTAFDEITESVGQWQENYSQNMEAIIDSNLQVIKSFNDMLQALSIDPDSITVKYDIAKAAKDQDIDSYDTGGYTGNWGNSGKLAMLHSKELVLNANDTANMLTAVQITRAMLDTIDLNARQASFGLGNLVASGIKDEKDNTLKQEVSIVAQFPNVQDHNEIEEALSNLINHASQYANRR